MENQHRQIKGYRELGPAEIELMNRIKEHGLGVQLLLAIVRSHVTLQRRGTTVDSASDTPGALAVIDEKNRLDMAEPERWAAIARTHFQEGLMALTRAVAQPTFF